MPAIISVQYRYPEAFSDQDEESDFISDLVQVLDEIKELASQKLQMNFYLVVRCLNPEGSSLNFCSADVPDVIITVDVPNDEFDDDSEIIKQMQEESVRLIKKLEKKHDIGLEVFSWWKPVNDFYPFVK